MDWDQIGTPAVETSPEPKPISTGWEHIGEPSDEDKLADMEGPINTKGVPMDDDTPVADDGLMATFGQEMEAWGEAIKGGWQDSTTRMLSYSPTYEHDPDMKGRHQFIKEVSQAFIDLPIDILAAIPGAIWGGGIGGVATSAGLSSGFRQWLMDQYGAGNVDPNDLTGRFMSTLKATAGGAAGGVVGGKVGGTIVGKTAPIYGKKVASWLSSPFELAAMSTTQGLIQHGQLPSASDFKTSAISMIAGKSVGHITGKAQDAHFNKKLQAKEHMEAKLAHIYAKTGVEPQVISKLAQNDPHMLNQLMDTKMTIPDSLMHMDGSDIMSKVDDGSQPTRTLKDDAKSLKNGVADAMVDDLGPIKRAFNQMAGSKDAWDRAAAWMNPYKRAALARGWAGKYEHLLEHGGWDVLTGKTDDSKGILKILQDVENKDAGTSLQGFAKWMVSRRSIEKEQQFSKQRRDHRIEMRDLKKQAAHYRDILEFDADGKPIINELTRKDHKDLVRIEDKIKSLTKEYKKVQHKRDNNKHTGMKQFDNAKTVREMESKYAQHEKDFMDFNRSMLKQLKDAGILSEDDMTRIMRDNESYVPFQRLMDSISEIGGDGSTKPKLFGGSDRPIRNPFEVYIESIRKNLRGIEHNTVLQHLSAWDDNGKFIKKIPLSKKDQTIEQVASKLGIDRDDVTAFDMMETVKMKGSKTAVIYGYENGQRVGYEVPKDMATSFQNLTGRGHKLINTDNPAAKLVWTILKKPSDILRFGATTTPDFMVANLLRDVTASFAFSKSTNGHLFSWAEGASKLLTKGKSESYKEMLRNGGQVMGQHRDGTSPHLNRDIYNELSKRPVKNKLSIETLNKLKDNVSDLTEGAARIGEYLAARADGQGGLEAAYRHRDITLDFARAGYVGRYINDIVTFHNAGIQSLNKLHTVMTTGTPAQRLKTVTALTTGVVLPSIVLNWAFGDDERVQQVPQWERDLYWIVPVGDSLMRLPKPHEVGIIFGSSIERAMDSWRRDDPHAWDGYMDSVLAKMVPGGLGGPEDFIGSITALKPFIEAAANHNFFRDTQLIPHYLEDVAPELQYSQNTTETARAISGVIGKLGRDSSPIVIDNFIQAWTAGAGKYVTGLVDTILTDNEVRPGHGQLKTGDWGWDSWQELPVIKSFIARDPEATGRARVIEQFRKRHQKALTESNSVSFLKNNFLFGDMRDRLDKKRWIKNEASYNTIREMGSLISKIYHLPPGTDGLSDKDLAQQKAIQIEQLYAGMVEAAKRGLQVYDDIDKIIKENE